MSSTARPELSERARAGRSPLLPAGTNRVAVVSLLIGFCALYLPSYFSLARDIWPTDEQGHGPIILAVSLWLLFSKREALAQAPVRPAPVFGGVLLGLSLLLYIFGRSQSFLAVEVGSQLPLIVGLLLIFRGPAALRLVWFPIFFLAFMVPLPEFLVSAITAPLKSAVSAVAAELLYWMGYPVARAGVLLSVGQYQLLVADACAGLNSIFTLEALGLLYMNLMKYKSVTRNTLLAIIVVPIAFCANIVRVLVLVLVTYYLGDEAGQGFVHGFAGMVLFLVGLTFMLIVDKVLGVYFPSDRAATT